MTRVPQRQEYRDISEDEPLKHYTHGEVAKLVKGATITCIKQAVNPYSHKTTFTAGRTYEVQACDWSLLEVRNDLAEVSVFFAEDYRRHFEFAQAPAAAAKPREVVHLTETGLHAGRRFCTADRSDGQRNVHGAYAPLDNPTFRATVCLACLKVWADEAYADGDTMPDYIAELRKQSKAGQGSEPAPAIAQLDLSMK